MDDVMKQKGVHFKAQIVCEPPKPGKAFYIPGGRLYVFSGENLLKPKYGHFMDAEMLAAATQPVFADSEGWVECYLDPEIEHRIVMTDAPGRTTVCSATGTAEELARMNIFKRRTELIEGFV